MMFTLMDRGRWSRLKKLFHDAVGMPDGEREEYLVRACPDDPPLSDEVRRLILLSDTLPADYLKPPQSETR